MLQVNAQQAAHQQGIALKPELAEGDEVKAIVESVHRTESDLLVLGIPRRYGLFSRLWNHTIHDLAQQLSSSILGVH
jgi:hypothetical protein